MRKFQTHPGRCPHEKFRGARMDGKRCWFRFGSWQRGTGNGTFEAGQTGKNAGLDVRFIRHQLKKHENSDCIQTVFGTTNPKRNQNRNPPDHVTATGKSGTKVAAVAVRFDGIRKSNETDENVGMGDVGNRGPNGRFALPGKSVW